ncbi:MAG: double-strand break repair helicase AddA [Bdellovibrionales bacterium]
MTSPARKATSAVDPNDIQRKASDPTLSAWVNASAGSGKTSVLTKRVMRLLLSGVSPQKILCLTYTRAGAAEMESRIMETLKKWAVCDNKELDDDLDKLQKKPPEKNQQIEARRLFAKVLSCPGGLRIRTIHSFCQEILSRFPIEAGLPPYFALIEDQELEVLKNEILDDLLREAADNPEKELAKALSVLVAAQGETGFAKMLKEVTRERGKLAKALDKAGGLDKLVARTRDLLQLEPDDTPDNIRKDVMKRAPEAELRKLAAWVTEETSYKEEKQRLMEVLSSPTNKRADIFDTYRLLFLTTKNEQRKAIASKEVRKAHPEIDDLCSKETARLLSALERLEAAELAETTESVLIFGHAFAERLTERKASRAALDYDDLILFTENLLRRSGMSLWVLYKLDNGLDHILLDEAQDTSVVQGEILKLLTGEFFAGEGSQENKNRTLFVVGDEKQSIFSFQNADVETFFSLHDYFSRHLEDAGKPLETISLNTSFRSAQAVLTAVDAVFEKEAARDGVSLAPVKHTAHPNDDGSDKCGRIEVWPLLRKEEKEKNKDTAWLLPTTREEDKDLQADLAQQIAQKIKGWLDRREILPGENRPIAAGDIMILLRRRGRFADLMVRALKTASVPVTGVDRMELVKQLPVMDLLALVRFVLLPEDDLNLASLLRSPLIGLSEEQLMTLAVGRKSSLWNSLKASSFCAAARDYLLAKLNEADFSTPFNFLARTLNAPCPANATSGLKALWTRLGDEALDPIEELLNKAQTFGKNHAPSLQNFLHWLTQSDMEIKRELDRNEEQVRIMTVHASKGLEAPIVFLPDTTAIPTDVPKFQWGNNDTPLFLAHAPKFGQARNIWQAAKDKQMKEYRRLLYVAMTRASRQLYICGWQSGRKEDAIEQSWYGLVEPALRPLHQSHLPTDKDGVTPEIVFADTVIPKLPPKHEKTPSAQKQPLPNWALVRVKEETDAVSSAPSYGADTNTATPDTAFARGRIIHRLLQTLPDIAPEKRGNAVDRFLSHPRHELTKNQRDDIAAEVHRLLNDETFAALFAPDSLAEAPLAGRIEGVNVFRQVDRLCLKDNEVWIVDYKTNRPPPESEEDVPAAYRRQLEEYRILLSGIYADKKVRCFLLWTFAPKLMEIAIKNNQQ